MMHLDARLACDLGKPLNERLHHDALPMHGRRRLGENEQFHEAIVFLSGFRIQANR
jgi:hypothetical protein